MQIEKAKQDLTYLEWSKIRNSSGTAGSFLKSTMLEGEKKLYCKLSDYDGVKGIIGHECINEIIVDRLLDIFGVEHLHYRLIHADVSISGKVIETYLCASEDFKNRGEEKMALDIYYDQEKEDMETPLEFCIRQGWEKYIYEMLAIDFIILNRDRHGANIEVLRNSKKKTIRLAPLFDHGISLLCRCHSLKDIEKYDVLDEKKVQCFVGGNSAKDNLALIPKDKLPVFNTLRLSDKEILISDFDGIVSFELLEKIWDMIWKRWCVYEDLCNKK
ncbi:MAG: hypothetical protein K6F64_10115 [Clostridia bacterium]|nr:hypothetical protein [Clostridia bacterium]